MVDTFLGRVGVGHIAWLPFLGLQACHPAMFSSSTPHLKIGRPWMKFIGTRFSNEWLWLDINVGDLDSSLNYGLRGFSPLSQPSGGPSRIYTRLTNGHHCVCLCQRTWSGGSGARAWTNPQLTGKIRPCVTKLAVNFPKSTLVHFDQFAKNCAGSLVGSGNQAGDKPPLPEPMLTQFADSI